MGFFTHDTEEAALKKVELINREMREIGASMKLNFNMIDGRNRSTVRNHYNNIISYWNSYNKIKANLSEYERGMLWGTTIIAWDGTQTGVLYWEYCLANVLEILDKEINY